MPAMTMAQGVALSSRMFAQIGVTLDWRMPGKECPNGAIRISPTFDTPVKLKPGAMAFALPYEGTYIRVFADRVVSYQGKQQAGLVLGHVMAHEITHILEGVARHSETGVMKAHWDREDNRLMVWKPLAFAKEDVELIHVSLAARHGETPALVAVE